MPSKALIANIACQRMGISKRIANVDTEASQEAVNIKEVFDHERDVVLRSWNWPWATGYVTLALVAGSTAAPVNDDWIYAYRYPAECLFARRIVSTSGRRPQSVATEESGPAFRVGRDAQGRRIFTNYAGNQSGAVVLEYTARVTDPEEFDPLFVSLLAWRLVMTCGPALSRREKLDAWATQNYLLEHPWAASVAANEGQQPADESEVDWHTARG